MFLDIVWRKTFWLSWTLLTLVLKARQEAIRARLKRVAVA